MYMFVNLFGKILGTCTLSYERRVLLDIQILALQLTRHDNVIAILVTTTLEDIDILSVSIEK